MSPRRRFKAGWLDGSDGDGIDVVSACARTRGHARLAAATPARASALKDLLMIRWMQSARWGVPGATWALSLQAATRACSAGTCQGRAAGARCVAQPAADDARRRCERMRDGMRLIDDVHHLDPAHPQRIRDQRTIAAPPQRFGA